MMDLDFVPTQELIEELVNRHDEIIVIRSAIKDNGLIKIRYKTAGLISGNIMLTATSNQLLIDNLEET